MKMPRVLGLVLCKRLEVDPTRAELSLTGLLHMLRCPSWPTPPQHFTAYTALHGGEGEGTMELVITEMATERDIFRRRWWFRVPDRDVTVHLEVPVRGCVFPAAGRYGVTLRFDGTELTRRHLDLQDR